jgi:hypothetical protein
MHLRSHLFRGLDADSPWNRAILLLTLGAGLFGAVLTVTSGKSVWLPVESGGTAFLSWALGRELDPDQQVSAIAAGVFGAVWALAGQPTALLPILALLLAERIVVGTIGLRPVPADLLGMVVLAGVVSFTPLGWVMGFALAIAIYLEGRAGGDFERIRLYAALGAAAVASIVATITEAFPQSLEMVHPILASTLGAIALISVLREPPTPVTAVDARVKHLLSRGRLHAGRALAGLAIFFGAMLSAGEAWVAIPMAVTLALALASSEVERIRHHPR